MEYWYGMRLRPAGIGCQPKDFNRFEDDPSGKYWNLICYNRELTKDETFNYSMDLIDIQKEGEK